MIKYSLYLLLLCLSTHSLAETIRAVVKIEHNQGATQIYRTATGDRIPSIITDPKVKKAIEDLAPGEDAVVEGRISFQAVGGTESKNFKPFFIIESLKPISLKRLGSVDYKASDRQFDFTTGPQFSPLTLPVSTEVASAITMTSTFLLMDALSSQSGEPSGRQDMRQALIISAGTMATLFFLYEQVKK